MSFGGLGNRRARHRAQLMPLTGKNLAEGIGKLKEAKVFRDWLVKTLEQEADIEKEREKAAQIPVCEVLTGRVSCDILSEL